MCPKFTSFILRLAFTAILLTVASFSIYSSGAPSDANPISCENCANAGSASSGACPSNSWHTSGSGVYSGQLGCRIYCVEWNTRNANPARKSRDERRPATGRNVNPVQSATDGEWYKSSVLFYVLYFIVLYCIVLYYIVWWSLKFWQFPSRTTVSTDPLVQLTLRSWFCYTCTLWTLKAS